MRKMNSETQIPQICTDCRMEDFYLKEETYQIIGLCMEVHKILGKGHSENVYGDALEYEFKMNNIQYEREKKYNRFSHLIKNKGFLFSYWYEPIENRKIFYLENRMIE